MPYLKNKDAARLHDKLKAINPATSGELNYCVCQLVMNYLNVQLMGTVDYSGLNAAIGALELAKQELIRRLVSPYENGKIRDNGDIFQAFIRENKIPTLL